MSARTVHPVYLVKGDGGPLQIEQLERLLDDLVGTDQRDLLVQHMPEDVDASVVVDAARTPPFLTDRRIIVVPAVGRFRADESEAFVEYLQQPIDTTTMVLVSGGGQLPQRLVKAVKAHGHVVDAATPTGKARKVWINDRLASAPVQLTRAAVDLVDQRLAEDLGELSGVLDALASAFGEGARIDVDQLDPYLGSTGVATPWELTDAIDSGDTNGALVQLRRMLATRHPLVVMATLQRHFGALLRLDGSGIKSDGEAASLLGMSPFPAKKALAQSRRLGSSAIARAVRLLADADIDLRGASAWPGDMVLEVLVARLSKLAPSGRRPARASAR